MVCDINYGALFYIHRFDLRTICIKCKSYMYSHSREMPIKCYRIVNYRHLALCRNGASMELSQGLYNSVLYYYHFRITTMNQQ